MKRANRLLLGIIVTVLALLLCGLFAVELTLPPEAYGTTARSARRGGDSPTTTTPEPAITELATPPLSVATSTSARATATVPMRQPASDTGPVVTLAPDATASPPAQPGTTVPPSGRIRLPGLIPAVDYKPGGEGVGYHDSTRGNEGGAYRTDDVDIETCTDGTPCYDVGWIVGGEWLAYDVQIARTDRYIFRIRVASPRSEARFHIAVNGVDVTGSLWVPQTGGYEKWGEVVSQPVRLAAGSYELRLVAETDSFNWRSMQITPSSTARSVATPAQ